MPSSDARSPRHVFVLRRSDRTGPAAPRAAKAPGTAGAPGGHVELLERRQLLSAAHALPPQALPTSVVTNRPDYHPGQHADIRGSGFRPDEPVRVQVLHTDGSPNTAPSHRPWVIRAGDDGRFRTSYLVGADDLNTALRVTAVGVASHRSASEAFTDSAPANDNFASRSTLSGTSITATGTNVGATKESGEPNHAGNSGGHSVWWTWTAPSTGGTVTIDTSGSSFDTLLGTYTGTSLSALTPVSGGSNDDSPAGGTNTSKVSFVVTPGATYQIAVDGYGGVTGSISLHLKLVPPLNLASTTTVTSTLGAAGGAATRPDHIVVVVEEDRAAGALGDPNMPYFNSLASGGLVFNNSHGVNAEADSGEMNYLALYSGSTQGIADDGRDYSWGGPNLAKSLFGAGLSFTGYSESLPADGSQVSQAADPSVDPDNHPDAYIRAYNPMAQFTDLGTGHTNADVNKTFKSFPAASGFASLPTVSFVIPDMFHSTHGSNESPYTNASNDYDTLRANADAWLKTNLDAYARWAKQNNSLLIVTGDEGDRGNTYTGRPDTFAKGVTTIVTGDPRLVVPGTDSGAVDQYHVLRTIENDYGLTPLGNSASAAPLDTDASGRLAPGGPSGLTSAAGQNVTFTAAVAPASANAVVPTGTVQFRIDGANYGAPVSLVNGSATSQPISTLAGGGHTVTAVYNGDVTYATSTSAAFTHTVNAPASGTAASATTVTSSANPSLFGRAVTLTAAVAPAASGAATPTGAVTFMDGSTTLGTATLDSAGQATLTSSALSVATHSITAAYGGDATYAATAAASSSALSQVVNAAPTATALGASANPSTLGQSVTFTASVAPVSAAAGTPAPTGTVQFTIDGANFGSPVALVNGSAASPATTSLAVGGHTVSAVYSGDGNFTGSSPAAALSQTVGAAATSTALKSSANPSTPGQSVTFTATVTTPAGTPASTGTVQFTIDGVNFGSPVTLTNGSAASAATTTLAAGGHAISAVYSGDGNFKTSTAPALTQTVSTTTKGANDNFASPSTLSGTSATATGTNVGATKESGEPNHAGNSGGHSVWYTWTPTTSGVVTIDTSGSSFDTLLATYTGSAVNALTAVPKGSNDDNPDGGTLTSKVVFTVAAGTKYQIAVDGYAGATGSIALHLNETVGIPLAPASVSATSGTLADRVRVTWGASSGASAYQVFRATTNIASQSVEISGAVVGSTTWDDTTAVHGTTYYYWVKAKSSAGVSGFSASAKGYR